MSVLEAGDVDAEIEKQEVVGLKPSLVLSCSCVLSDTWTSQSSFSCEEAYMAAASDR